MTRKLVAVGAVTCALMAIIGVANAAAALYVSNTVPKGNGKSCAQPGFSGVNEAVAAAATGATIDVCAGTYTEQVEIGKSVKVVAINGTGTAKLVMPASPAVAASSCDTSIGPEQRDEISICTPETVTITGVNLEAEIPLETCAGGLYGIFVAGGATLRANNMNIVGASTSLNNFKGCQHGVAVEVGNKTPAEVGHAVLKNLTVSGYEKNGPTVKSPGSTMTVAGSTITGEGPSPWIAQNGVEVAFGAKGIVQTSSIAANECNVASCGATGEQASGALFYQAAPGSKLSSSHVNENDLGAYYASGSSTLSSTPEVTMSSDVLTSNRYEGVGLEEGRALLNGVTINGSGRVGIDLYQFEFQESASNSTATNTSIEGQSEAAIKVESDKSPSDKPGKFTFTKSTATNNGSVLINESNNFQVIF